MLGVNRVAVAMVPTIPEAVATGLGVNKVAMVLVEASVVNGLAHSSG